LQVLFEPFRRQTRHLFERARLFKEARRAQNDLHFFFTPEAWEGFLIQFNDKPVGAADDEQRRRRHERQDVSRQVGTPPRETTAPTLSPGLAAGASAAAPVLAPK
jgi:hypothetical protein